MNGIGQEGLGTRLYILNVNLISISYIYKLNFFSADERRLAHMMSKLNSSTRASSSSRTAAAGLPMASGGKSIRTDTTGSGGSYAGGIFSRLEAQFRAQQTAKALALQATQTRQVKVSAGSGKSGNLEIMFKTSIVQSPCV